MPPRCWSTESAACCPPAAVERLIVLEASDFAVSVQQALKEFARPLSLRQNPLLRSRLVLDQVGMQADEAERIVDGQAEIVPASELRTGDLVLVRPGSSQKPQPAPSTTSGSRPCRSNTVATVACRQLIGSRYQVGTVAYASMVAPTGAGHECHGEDVDRDEAGRSRRRPSADSIPPDASHLATLPGGETPEA